MLYLLLECLEFVVCYKKITVFYVLKGFLRIRPQNIMDLAKFLGPPGTPPKLQRAIQEVCTENSIYDFTMDVII